MNILQYIFSLLPDNSSKKITAKDVRDSFAEMDKKIDQVDLGITGDAELNTQPSLTKFERWTAYTAGTYTNFKELVNGTLTPITIIPEELDNFDIILSVTNGVAKKNYSKKKDSKTKDWEAKAYLKDIQVFHKNGIYESSEPTLSTDVPGISLKWKPKVLLDVELDKEGGALSYNRGLGLIKVLDYFVSNSFDYTTINKADYQVINGALKTDNTVESSGSERTILNIPVSDIERFSFDGWRLRTITANLGLYCSALGITKDGSVEVIIPAQDKTDTIGRETFEKIINKYQSVSVSWSYYNDVPAEYPILKLGKYNSDKLEINAVKNYIDLSKGDIEILKDLLKNFYNGGVFNLILDKSKYNILNAVLQNDNTTISSPWERTILDIPCVGFSTVDFDGWRVRTAAGNISLYPTILGIKSDGTKVVLLNSQDNTLPTGKETFKGINIVDYVKLSIAWAYYNDVPAEYPIIKLNKPGGVDKIDYVKRYIDEKARAGGLSFKDFGAKCDGVTNDTQAFKDAINYLISIGGGKIYLPPGEMLINQIEIPRIGNPNSFMTIEIYGDYVPTGVYGSVGNIAINRKNSVLKCLDTVFDADKGVIYTTMGTGSPWDFNYMTFVIHDLVVRTSNPSTINALNLRLFQQAYVENVNVDNGVYAGQASEPIVRTVGISMPEVNNGAYSYLKNSSVSGFYDGFIFREHTVTSGNIVVNCCKTGAVMGSAFHPIIIERLLVQKCHRVIEVITRNTGEPSNFDIRQLAIEAASANTIDPGHEWQLPDTYSVYDDNNKAMGYITYTYHVGGMGEGSFSKSPVGGSKLRIRQLGDLNYV
ncbi:hypothetical protein CMU99_16405 [Elizabethkingia anophelis]|nr:hypothetical protein [Elizabethkingia anophelis]